MADLRVGVWYLETGHGGQFAITQEGTGDLTAKLNLNRCLITPLHAYGEPWSITWLLQPLARMTILSARFQTDNKSCAGRGTEGGRGGIGRRL